MGSEAPRFQQITSFLDVQKNFEQLQSLLEGFGKRARVYSSVDQTIPDNDATILSFDSEEYDTVLDVDSMHDLSDDSKLTVKTAGVYDFWTNVAFDVNGAGQRSVQVLLNGATNIATANRAASGTVDWIEATGSWLLVPGDYLEVVAYQDSGGDLDVLTSLATSPVFGMKWASP